MIRDIVVVFFTSFFLINAIGDRSQPFYSSENNSEANHLFIADTETPFLHEAFKYGNITMKNGRVIANVKLRVNLETQETQFMSVNNITAVLPKGAVKEITYTDTTDNQILLYKLKTGYPATDKQTPAHFYIVLSDGHCIFLKLIYKKVTEKRNDMDLTTFKEYETSERYYFYSNGSMKLWKKDKDFVLPELADKSEQVNKFVLDNKTSFRNVESVVLLLNYYNSL